VLCLGLSIFAVVVAAIGVFDMVIVSGVTVLAGLLICFFRMEIDKSKKSPNWLRLTLHGLMALALTCIFFEWGHVMFEQEEFFITISERQNAFGWVAIALIGYLSFRFLGAPMLAVLVGAAIYLLLPDTLGGAGVGWSRAAENLWFSTDGVFGRPVEVIGRIVLIFVVFGAVLQQSGAGEVLLKIALAATGRFSGGPAARPMPRLWLQPCSVRCREPPWPMSSPQVFLPYRSSRRSDLNRALRVVWRRQLQQGVRSCPL
jgi:TRAP-type uncharacterized transport system fused permease subunit